MLSNLRLLALAAAAWLLLKRVFSARRKRAVKAVETNEEGFSHGKLDMRRKAQIGFGQASDYARVGVVVAQNESFNLNKTIFASIKSPLTRAILHKKLAITLCWNDRFIDEVHEALSAIPAPVPVSSSIFDFMRDECDFSCEHADGSFMDHLRFCYDYSAAHFKAQSPRVMLLHSIMGVGTNIFPMEASKIPALAKLVNPEEMRHIQAFPTILRLLLNNTLLTELKSARQKKKDLKAVFFQRVIDNETVDLKGEELWIHLNYQLIHLLDFLPVAEWDVNQDDSQFRLFLELFAFLTTEGKLTAEVSIEAESLASEATGCVVGDYKAYSLINLKSSAKQWMTASTLNSYSKACGHDMAFQICH